MRISRREFVRRSALGTAVGISGAGFPASADPGLPWKAVAFDAYPVFDPRPVFALAEEIFPGKGSALSDAWRSRQFEYQWLRALSQRYADFEKTTEDALVFAAELLNLDLTAVARKRLVDAYSQLKPWPDVTGSLQTLKGAGLRLAFLSNMTSRMLEANLKNSGLDGLFDPVISTDAIKTYKQDPRAYAMAATALGLKREEILFVAFAGWDAAGARSFGYPTFWVNRMNQPAEQLGAIPDADGRTLEDLVRFAKQR
jgi:2-haloacid dehalogenase